MDISKQRNSIEFPFQPQIGSVLKTKLELLLMGDFEDPRTLTRQHKHIFDIADPFPIRMVFVKGKNGEVPILSMTAIFVKVKSQTPDPLTAGKILNKYFKEVFNMDPTKAIHKQWFDDGIFNYLFELEKW